MSNSLEKLEKANSSWENLFQEFEKFSRKKSLFSIEHWTVAQEGAVPSHQYKFLLHQIRMNLYQLRLWDVEYRKAVRKIERLTKNQPEDWDLDVLQCQIQIDDLHLNIKGRSDELEDMSRVLNEIKESNPEITWETYEEDEPVYWTTFLARKAASNIINRQKGIGVGEAKAMLDGLQAPVLEESTSLPANILAMSDEEMASLGQLDYKLLCDSIGSKKQIESKENNVIPENNEGEPE
jgi:hypothetical protein